MIGLAFRGDVGYKGKIYLGEQRAVVDRNPWNGGNALLKRPEPRRHRKRNRQEAL
jgi:hypothetical protein